MSELIDRQEMAIRYLLDDLSEQERAALEDQFFSDDEVFQELEIAEDELIDRYVRTELSPEETGRFEKLLVSPRLAERVELARILAQKIPPPPPVPVPDPDPVPNPDPPGPWWKTLVEFSSLSPGYRVAFAGALLVLLLLSVPIFFVWKRSTDEARRQAAEQQQRDERRRIEQQTPGSDKPAGTPEQAKEDKEEKEEQLQPPKEYQQQPQQPRRPAVGSFVSLDLAGASGTRSGGGDIKTIELREGVAGFDLYLDVSRGDYPGYNARVEDMNRKLISQQLSLKPKRRQGINKIRCRVAAQDLSPGDYTIRVDGITDSGTVENFDDYLFRVVAR